MMQKVMVMNSDNGNILVENAVVANSFFTRLKGLRGKKSLFPGEGLLIYPCAMIHSIGMKMDFDVLFLSSSNQVVHLIEKMMPNRKSTYVCDAKYVLELPAGQISRTGTMIGHKIWVINEKLVKV